MSAAVAGPLLAPGPTARRPVAAVSGGFERVLHDELAAPGAGADRPEPRVPRNRSEGALHRASARAASDETHAPHGRAHGGRLRAVSGQPGDEAATATTAPADGAGAGAAAGQAAAVTAPAAPAEAGPVGAAATGAAGAAADGSDGARLRVVGPVTGPVPAVALAAAAGEAALAAQLAAAATEDAAGSPAVAGPGSAAAAVPPQLPAAASSTAPEAAPATLAASAVPVAGSPAGTPSVAAPPTATGAVAPGSAVSRGDEPAAGNGDAGAGAPPGVPAPEVAGGAGREVSSTTSAPGRVEQVPTVPLDATATGVATAPAAAVRGTAAPSAPTVPAPGVPEPIATQLGARLRSLSGLGAGRHVLSVPLDPEHLGPVRVVAHISADVVRVDLVGSSDASRDALRGALTELRRDLADAGLNVEVGLGGGGHQEADTGRPSSFAGPPLPDEARPAASPAAVTVTRSASRGLDVLA